MISLGYFFNLDKELILELDIKLNSLIIAVVLFVISSRIIISHSASNVYRIDLSFIEFL